MGGDTINTKEYADVDKMYVDHALQMRRQPLYSKSVISVDIEANTGAWQNANRIADLFRPSPRNVDAMFKHKRLTNGASLEPLFFVQKDPKGGNDRGVWTGPEQLDGGTQLLRDALESGKFCIADNFVSRDSRGFLDKFKKQLQHFREEITEPADPIHGKVKRKFTGKSGGKQDDVVVTIMLVMFWFRFMQSRPTYQEYCKARGIPIY